MKDMGQLDEARPLLKEYMQAKRYTLGDRHPVTLTSISNMGTLLMDMGQLEEARPLFEEALQARRETLGDRHASTLISIRNMGTLLKAMDKLPGGDAAVRRGATGEEGDTLGDRTLGPISNVGQLLKAMGKLAEARPLYEEGLQVRVGLETLGDCHPHTLACIQKTRRPSIHWC